ncbi:MAG: GTP-binding protein [Oscillospiraceae bacterium]
MDLYLITGFLGAGKTSFLKNFIKLFEDKKIYLIVNEFGKESIDGTILKQYNSLLSEINNGSIFCACRLDKFEQELSNAKNTNPDIIIVEASGLSDPTNICRIMDDKSFKDINYKGSVCLIDATSFHKVVETARVVTKQISVSSFGVINKTDISNEDEIRNVILKAKEINPSIKLEYTQFGKIDERWISYIVPNTDINSADNIKDITLQKAVITLNNDVKKIQLNGLLRSICEDTYRIKGFVSIEGVQHLIDCVGAYVKFAPYDGAIENNNKLVVLAGAGMNLRKSLKNAKNMYNNIIKEIDV